MVDGGREGRQHLVRGRAHLAQGRAQASTPGPKPDGLIYQVSNANPDWATARTNNSDLAKGRTRS